MSDKKLLTCGKSGVKIIPADKNGVSPFTLPEPAWIPDKQILQCSLCKVKFDLFNRKHHCRRCGTCICNKCCHKKPLPRMCFIDPVLQCNLCSLISIQENIFFDEHLKSLLQGAVLNVTYYDVNIDNVKPISMFCKLNHAHRELLFQCENSQTNVVDPIKVSEINELTKISSSKNSDISGVKLSYNNTLGESCTLTLKVTSGSPLQHFQLQWVEALNKAFELVTETKKLTSCGDNIDIQE